MWRDYSRQTTLSSGKKSDGSVYRYRRMTRQGYEDFFEDLMEYSQVNPYQKDYLENHEALKKRLWRETSGSARMSDEFLSNVVNVGLNRSLKDVQFRERTFIRVKRKQLGKQVYKGERGTLVYRTKYPLQGKEKGKERYVWRDTKGRFSKPPVSMDEYSPAKAPPELPK